MKKLFFTLLLVLGFAVNGWCATLYARNVTANWGTASTWSTTGSGGAGDGSVPTASDDVVFDSGYTGTVTIAADAVCKSLVVQAGASGTLIHNAGYSLTISGNLTLDAGITYAPSADTCAIVINATSSVTTAGKSLGNFSVNGSGITVTLQDAFTTRAATTLVNLVAGTLDTNGQTCVWGKFQATTTGTRTLTLGASQVTISGTGTAWSFGSTANLNANTSTITLTGAGVTGSMGGKIYNVVEFTGSGTATINGGTYGTLRRTGTAVKTDSFSFTGGLTVTGTLDLDGNSAINRILVTSSALGTARTITITGATISGCSNVDFRDITFANGGSNVDLSSITGGSGDCGGNTISGGGILSFTPADDWYWQTTGAGTYDFSDATYWFTATNGGGDSGDVRGFPPLPQDNCFFDANSITGATVVDQDMPRMCKTLDFTGVNAMDFHLDNISQTFYGSMVMSANVTITNGGALTSYWEGRGAFSFKSNGKTIFYSLHINGIEGTLTLLDDMYRSGTTMFNNGTFDADIFNLTSAVISSGSGSATRVIYMGSGTWTVNSGGGVNWSFGTNTGLTLYCETSTIVMSSASSKTFSGGGLVYNNFTETSQSGVTTISGSNTFNTFTINAPKTVKFTDGTTQTVSSFVATGDASNAITITGTSTGGWIISDTAGTNLVSYCTISYSTAQGGATWDASDGTNTDGGNNSGWVFAVAGVTDTQVIMIN